MACGEFLIDCLRFSMAVIYQLREPLELAVGDTLAFQRYLPDYLPSNGWSLLYQISGYPIGTPAPEFTSTPDVTNTIHQILVGEAVTAGWLECHCVLTGYAVSAIERHQFYYAELTLAANLGTGTNQVVVTTHAQRMIPLLEAQLEALAAHSLQDTTIQQTEIRRLKRMDLEKQLGYNKELRMNEIEVENVRNGRPSGNKIRPVMNIVAGQPAIGGGPSWPFAQ
jgi:hypothetical protein